MLQYRADILKHLVCLSELVQIDKQNALKFTPSHFTSRGDSSHSEAEVHLAGETQLSDGGTACSTNIWISSHHCNEYLCAVWAWVAYSPLQTHTNRFQTHAHRPQVSPSSAPALNLASHMSSPGLLQRTRTSLSRHTRTPTCTRTHTSE